MDPGRSPVIDLHAHSTASDGTATPTELVTQAARAAIGTIAITDHDTSSSWPEAADAATRLGIGLVRGTEFSTRFRGLGLHLLAYLYDPGDPAIVRMQGELREARWERAREMVRRLAADFPLTWDDVAAQAADDATIGRPHLADALVVAGVIDSRAEGFASILHSSSPYVVKHKKPDTVAVIQAVRAAGGVPILAHPAARKRGPITDDGGIRALAAQGLAGLEVAHRDHTPADRARLNVLAIGLGLIRTGGSDWHGAGKPNRLSEERTTPAALEAIAAQATGVPILERR
ncbi:MAG: PHP domain-containing protein [Micrococcales bacterium]|nr:PHP domain-containing protein [Micrococcales bacterium]